MKVLITGGAGFIGSHLANRYLTNGHDVYTIDDLSTGSRNNIKFLEKNSKFKNNFFVTIDSILNRNIMLELIGICDIVVHLAAAVGVKYIIEHPLSSIVTNIKGTEIVLEYCDKFKKKVFLTSTSEVYGKHTHAPLIETDDSVFGPSTKSRWSYAASKLVDEFTALAYNRTRGLEVIIGRLFNTVGPRQTGRYGMVIPRFLEQAINNKPLTIYGDGTQSRTFTYVEDVITAITKLIDCPESIGNVYNIGSEEEITIVELAKKIIGITNSKSTIEFIPYEKVFTADFEDMQRRVPSTKKIYDCIKWKPSLNIDEILQAIYSSIK